MPRFLGRRLECFYCGSRSAQRYTQGLREWQCKKCDAVNYLDKNGDITDPPALQNPSQTRYAQPRPASPEALATEESLFCLTCLKNQHLLTQSLAEYYPSPDHPDYSKYEKEYPRYRKNLEERYPQICEQCEPRVRARIQQTGYAAKTDHLRRMMEQTRGSGRRRQVWGWKSAAAAAGGAVWYLSLLGQFAWHLISTLKAKEELDGLQDTEPLSPLSSCLRQDLKNPYVASVCSEAYSSAAEYALCLGLLSIWWNPRLKEKFMPRHSRVTGTSEYYKLQAIFLAVRFAAWRVLGKIPTFDFNTQMAKGIHAFMLVFIILSIIISYRTVQVDHTPLVNFQDSPGPLLARRSQKTPVNTLQQSLNSQITLSNVQNSQRATRSQPFPIEKLAPTPYLPYPPAGGPLTPPLEEDDSEAMDWTPSQQGSLRTPSSYRSSQSKPIPVQPSPFYGKLPPNPTSQNHRLRNALNQPPLLGSSTPRPKNFFNRMVPLENHDEISDVGSEPSSSKQATSSPQFAPPKFFPPSDHRDNTGLESIFSNTFTLGEEPAEVRAARQQQEAEAVQHSTTSTALQRVLTISLMLATLAWYRGCTLSVRLLLPIRLASLGLSTVVAGRNLSQAIQKDKAFWSLSDMLLFGCELGMAIFLGGVVKKASSEPFLQESEGLDNLGLGLLVAMTVQEIWIAINDFRNVSSGILQQAAPAPTPTPAKAGIPPPPLPQIPQQPSPTLISSSFSTQTPTYSQPVTTHTSPRLTNPSFSTAFSSYPPSNTPTYASSPSLTRAPTNYHPSFSTTAPSPTPTQASLAPSDSYSTFAATPRVSQFSRTGSGRRDSDLGGLGGLSLGGGGSGATGRSGLTSGSGNVSRRTWERGPSRF